MPALNASSSSGSAGGTATTWRGTIGDGAVVSPAEGVLTIGPATVGDVADEGATAGVSAGDGLSGWGIINTAINVRAKPAIGNTERGNRGIETTTQGGTDRTMKAQLRGNLQ